MFHFLDYYTDYAKITLGQGQGPGLLSAISNGSEKSLIFEV